MTDAQAPAVARLDDNELLRPREVCKILNVGIQWVTDRIGVNPLTPTIPHLRLGTGPRARIRIRRGDLNQFIANLKA